MRLVLVAAAALAVLAVGVLVVSSCMSVRTDRRDPPDDLADALRDDQLSEKKRPAFDPSLVRPVRVGEDGAWVENRSAAQFRLDVPVIQPDVEPHLLRLHASYAAAIAANGHRGEVLVSVNMADGKAKQFDDGLCAALDLARMPDDVSIVRRLFEAVSRDGAAAPFLAAGLEIAGVRVEPGDAGRRDTWLDDFRRNELSSKPIGYFTWSDALGRAFRFRRFFQQTLSGADLPIAAELAAALRADGTLQSDYARTLALSAGLHDPPACRSVLDVGDAKSCALFPPMSSREVELFSRLFPDGVPLGVSLMSELVRRVRSGEVDLSPRSKAGWLDHQVHALETLLLPERAEERDKLLLTRRYKKRMLEAFEALLTKRLETHASEMAVTSEVKAPEGLRPTMRVEPCPTFFLRTARAYGFLATFLESSLGGPALGSLHGLREKGDRGVDLLTELRSMRELFYGLYFVAIEDLGMRSSLVSGESVDRVAATAAAVAWLARAANDPDLAVDTRVSVPVHADRARTRLWGTIGVRMARLDVAWTTRPRIRRADGVGEWADAKGVVGAEYLIPVDEFAEFELGGGRALSREEFRHVCDAHATRAEILEALRD
jgi:hypothetical protein